ncbi:hypothetical protein [Neomegalonema sp.]|uniref:hypothetical protein n=1 Tax=Neomegalonema sp. TaxID=2039713 RepID=UPI00261CEC6C|nr:hypothetical protein [Neomegalonema sp.]MDD2870232.1 hypothetical protein [Neomegalonema sp.]
MPKVVFVQPFKFSPDGVEIIEYPVGGASVSARCAEVAELAGVLEGPEKAASKGAPEVKS